MKTLALLATAALAASASAGQPVMTGSSKTVIPPEPCFGETEFQIDAFGVYTWYDGKLDDGWGGGLALTYFFNRHVGLSAEGSVSDTGSSTAWNVGGNLVLRYPCELGGLCLAPYAKTGAGYHINGDDEWYYSVGGGLEFRVTPRVGIFGEGSYNWAGGNEDFAQARAGVRFVF